MAKKKKASEEDEDAGKGGKGKMIAAGVVGAVVVYRFVLAPGATPAEEAARMVMPGLSLVLGLPPWNSVFTVL